MEYRIEVQFKKKKKKNACITNPTKLIQRD